MAIAVTVQFPDSFRTYIHGYSYYQPVSRLLSKAIVAAGQFLDTSMLIAVSSQFPDNYLLP
jgi:hypothetical protein